MRKISILIALSAGILGTQTQANVYKHTDGQGNITYSDTSMPEPVKPVEPVSPPRPVTPPPTPPNIPVPHPAPPQTSSQNAPVALRPTENPATHVTTMIKDKTLPTIDASNTSKEIPKTTPPLTSPILPAKQSIPSALAPASNPDTTHPDNPAANRDTQKNN